MKFETQGTVKFAQLVSMGKSADLATTFFNDIKVPQIVGIEREVLDAHFNPDRFSIFRARVQRHRSHLTTRHREEAAKKLLLKRVQKR